jgi:hypothetical protein
MAKRKKVRRKRKIGHVRLICPHCGRHVTVQRPSAFQRTMPCTNCRIPIASSLIIATSEGSAQSDVAPVQEESSEESVTEEAAATSA